MTLRKQTIRWAVRLAALAAAVMLAWGGPVPFLLGRVLPGLSPLTSAVSPIAGRNWFLGVLWALPPLVVLALAVWKGRWFCRWVCPAGTLYEVPSRLGFRRWVLKARLGGYMFWIIVFGSLAGAPLFLWADPLSTFNRLTPLLRGVWTLAALVPGLLLPVMLVLSAVQPMIWCTQFCPLGYGFDLVHSIPRQTPRKVFDRNRRQILIGLALGLPGAMLVRRFLFARSAYAAAPILPPGAKDLETFAATCTRCYACVNACPAEIIHPAAPGDRSIGQIFQPEIAYFENPEKPDKGFCIESCRQCSQVCPTGALTPLTERRKLQRKIGTARVIRSACLAWTDGQYCMVCQEFCPYTAIELDFGDGGAPKPVVKPDTCRGCGLCYKVCPAVRAGKAIVVDGAPRQSDIQDEYADMMGA